MTKLRLLVGTKMMFLSFPYDQERFISETGELKLDVLKEDCLRNPALYRYLYNHIRKTVEDDLIGKDGLLSDAEIAGFLRDGDRDFSLSRFIPGFLYPEKIWDEAKIWNDRIMTEAAESKCTLSADGPEDPKTSMVPEIAAAGGRYVRGGRYYVLSASDDPRYHGSTRIESLVLGNIALHPEYYVLMTLFYD